MLYRNSLHSVDPKEEITNRFGTYYDDVLISPSLFCWGSQWVACVQKYLLTSYLISYVASDGIFRLIWSITCLLIIWLFTSPCHRHVKDRQYGGLLHCDSGLLLLNKIQDMIHNVNTSFIIFKIIHLVQSQVFHVAPEMAINMKHQPTQFKRSMAM